MKKNILIILTSFVFVGCYYDKEEELYGVCSTNNVTYNTTIASMLNANGCLGCHSGTTPDGGVNLQGYANVKAKATEMRNGTSVLYGSVNHMSGFSAMPKGLAKMSSCDISKIKAWVDAQTPQ
jgi:hypothetical protein